MAKGVLFGPITARKLAAIADAREGTVSEARPTRFRESQRSPSVLVRAPDGGIPAASSTTAGSAVCWICKLGDSDQIEVTSDTITVKNWLTVDVMATGSKMGKAIKDRFGTYWASADDCADTAADRFEDPA